MKPCRLSGYGPGASLTNLLCVRWTWSCWWRSLPLLLAFLGTLYECHGMKIAVGGCGRMDRVEGLSLDGMTRMAAMGWRRVGVMRMRVLHHLWLWDGVSGRSSVGSR